MKLGSLAAVEDAWQANAFVARLERQPLLRYGLAAAAVATGMGLRLALTAWVGPGLPTYVTFYPAVMVAALLGGLGPGLVATALAGLAAGYWLLAPVGQLAVASPVDRLSLVVFAGMGLFMSVVAELYRRGRAKAAAYDREKALREVRQEQEFLADLLEHAAQPFAVAYPDGRIGRINRAYEQLTGYSAAELRALDWSATLTPPEWRELEKQKLDELQRRGQPVRYEKEYVRKDGSRVPIELLVHLVRDARGNPECYYSFIADLTERKRAESVLRTTLQRFYDVLSSMYAAVLLVTDDGRVEFANQAFCDQFGLSDPPTDLVGLAAPEMMEKITNAYRNPGDAVARIREILDRGQPVHGEELAMRDGRTCLRDFVPLSIRGKSHGRLWLQVDITERQRIEQALRESEERHRSAMDDMIEGCQILGRDWRYLYINDAAERHNRRPRADFIGKRYMDVWPGIERTHVFALIQRCLEDRSAHTIENESAFPDGTVGWFDLRIQPVPEGVFILSMDVTERKHAEAALRQSREDLDRAQAVGRIGSWRLDVGRNVLTWSEETHRIFGLPKGTPMSYETFLSAIHPDDRQYVDAKWRAGLAGEPYDIEHRIVADGRVKWVHEKAHLEFDADGELVGGFGTAQDITDRRATEEALRHSEEKYRRIIETANEGVWITDADRKTVLVNERMASMLGYAAEELIGRIPAEFLDDEYKPLTQGVRQRLDLGQAIQQEFKFRRKDGSALWVISCARTLPDTEVRRRITISMLTDITDRKQAEEALHAVNEDLERRVRERTDALEAQASQLRGLAQELTLVEHRERRRLAQLLHDDLQQIMVGARYRLELLRSGDHRSARNSHLNEICGLISQAIDVSRTLTGELSPPVLQDGGLPASLRWLARWAKERFGLAVHVASDVDPDVALPEETSIVLFQAVRELLFNVAKHAKVKTAEVSMTAQGDRFRVQVSDKGRGFRDPLGAVAPEATSYGLFNVRERLAFLGGSVSIDSAPGKGSRISLEVPVGGPSPARPVSASASAADLEGPAPEASAAARNGSGARRSTKPSVRRTRRR